MQTFRFLQAETVRKRERERGKGDNSKMASFKIIQMDERQLMGTIQNTTSFILPKYMGAEAKN